MKTTLLAAALLASPALASYSLVKTYEGSNFFDGWTYYDFYDNTTSGDVTYVNQSLADSDKLTYVNSDGQAIVKVDNTSFVIYNDKRNSVRITTADYFPVNSVILFDASHLPYGCSVWPSFWTKGENWPEGGEIDIVEGVNGMTANQMALHTENGCSATEGASASGTLGATNCSAAAGCTYTETAANSYGADFASAGGGVFGTVYNTSGIYIWFWGRTSIPTTVSSNGSTLDTSDWGTPSANYPASSCTIDTYFAPQQIVIDITLCGDWAGLTEIYPETCPIVGASTANSSSCYLQNVINAGNQSALDTAYFAINSVKVYNANGTVVSPSGVSSSVSPTSMGATGSGSGSGSGSKSGANARAQVGVLVAGVSVLLAWTIMGSVGMEWR